MLVLTRADVEELLDLDELVGALARAHEELSSGAVSMPPRIAALATARPARRDAGLLCRRRGSGASSSRSSRTTPTGRRTRRRSSSSIPRTARPSRSWTGPTSPRRARRRRPLSPRGCSRGPTRRCSRSSAPASRRARTCARSRTSASGRRSVSQDVTQRRRRRSPPSSASHTRPSFEAAVRGADVVAAATHSAEPVVLRGVGRARHARQLGRLQRARLGARPCSRARVHDRRRVAGIVVRAAPGRRPGARRRRPGARLGARRARLGRSDAAEPPPSKLRCTSRSASPCRIWRPRRSF